MRFYENDVLIAGMLNASGPVIYLLLCSFISHVSRTIKTAYFLSNKNFPASLLYSRNLFFPAFESPFVAKLSQKRPLLEGLLHRHSSAISPPSSAIALNLPSSAHSVAVLSCV